MTAVLLSCFLALSKLGDSNLFIQKIKAASSLLNSFLSSQLFLFYALLLWVSGHSLHKWQKVADIREQWNNGQNS